MEIDGYNVGYLKSVTEPSMEGEIAVNELGPANVQKKHVANIKWTGAKASVGIGMGKGMYEWIKQSFDMGYSAKTGRIVSADFDYKAQSELSFEDALITAVTVPKLEGSAKVGAYFDIEFEPERVRYAKAGGEVIKGDVGEKQKSWLTSNYRVEGFAGLPLDRVASVDSFTWKCAIVQDQVGITREATKHPAKVTVPDIKLSISMADYAPWAAAAKKWFIDGHHLESDEMEGRIVFLGPNMSDELGSIDLKNVGFKKVSRQALEANSEKIARFDVEFYVEKMIFDIKHFNA